MEVEVVIKYCIEDSLSFLSHSVSKDSLDSPLSRSRALNCDVMQVSFYMEKIRRVDCKGSRQRGQSRALRSDREANLGPHSSQRQRCPQGTAARTGSPSWQTTQQSFSSLPVLSGLCVSSSKSRHFRLEGDSKSRELRRERFLDCKCSFIVSSCCSIMEMLFFSSLR